jgi:hypothetical protein
MKKILLFVWKYWIFALLAAIVITIAYQVWPYIDLKVELSIYFAIAAAMFVFRTILSGRKLGGFYHKNDDPLPPFLKEEIGNMHYIETPAWWVQSVGIFLFMLSVNRVLDYSTEFLQYALHAGSALLFTLGTILAASLHFQRGVTAGLKDAANLDATTKSEVAFNFLFIHFKFWKPRLFSNRGRIVAQYLGIALILGSIYLIIWL